MKRKRLFAPLAALLCCAMAPIILQSASIHTSSDHRITTENKPLADEEDLPKYWVKLSALPETQGSVTGEGTYEKNRSVTVKATPKEGYRFVKWTENDKSISIKANYTFKINKNRMLIAHFVDKDAPILQFLVTLSAEPPEGGTTTGEGSFDENSSVTVKALPKEGYHFVKWTEQNRKVSEKESYTFKIKKARTLVAHFNREGTAATQHKITLSAEPPEGGTTTGEGQFEENSSVTVKALPKEGYHFVKWTEQNRKVSEKESYTFKINKPRTLVAHFNRAGAATTQHRITLSAEPPEGGTTTGEGQFDENSSVTVKALPKEGYHFVKWTEQNRKVSEKESYTFKINKPRTLVAHFNRAGAAATQHEITLSAEPPEGGTTTGEGQFEENSSVTVKALPKEGYHFVKWTEQNKKVSEKEAYTFTIKKRRSLIAHFIETQNVANHAYNEAYQIAIDQQRLTLTTSDQTLFILYNLQGVMVRQAELTANIPYTTLLLRGVYIIRMKTERREIIEKVVIQ